MFGAKKPAKNREDVLDVDASFQGNLSFKDPVNLRINGHFEGNLETRGKLLVSEVASVRANLTGDVISIDGKVTGDVTGAVEVRIGPSAKVIGDIRTPRLILEPGGVLHGMARMLPEGELETGSRQLFLTLDEVSRYLSVETELVTEWAESGKLPGARDTSGWSFDKRKVDEWIANGRVI